MTAFMLLLAIVSAQLALVVTGYLYSRELERELASRGRSRPGPAQKAATAAAVLA